MNAFAKFVPLLLSGLSLAACGGGGSSSPAPTAGGGTPTPVPPTNSAPEPVLLSDIEYTQSATTNGSIPLLLDIYQPDDSCPANRPTVLFVHGGGFVAGDKASNNITRLAEAVNEKDMNFVSIQYRLLGDDPVLSPTFQNIAGEFIAITPILQQPLVTAAVAATEDTVTALTWMEDNADDFCLDTTNLAYWGSSAGSITVMQVAYGLNQFSIARPEPVVVIDYWGDLPRDTDLEFREAPLFILHGNEDDVVPYQSALDLEARADAVGVPFAFYTVDGAGHAFDAIDIFTLESSGVTLIDQTVNFIEAHLVGGLPDYITVTISD